LILADTLLVTPGVAADQNGSCVAEKVPHYKRAALSPLPGPRR